MVFVLRGVTSFNGVVTTIVRPWRDFVYADAACSESNETFGQSTAKINERKGSRRTGSNHRRVKTFQRQTRPHPRTYVLHFLQYL